MTDQGRCELYAGLNVSRETFEKLRAFELLVKKWTKGINLVSKATVEDIWKRHILNSAQIFNAAPKKWQRWADLGSGGGFPGIVIATLAQEMNADAEVLLVESDQRKAAFLRTAARELDLSCHVICDRIEGIQPLDAEIVSARALAGLPQLLGLTSRHLAQGGCAIFPKGARAADEIAAARKDWHFALTEIQSITDQHASILKIEGITRA
ncbi:16S rRNA (guanine(527)-N(7))-methyltransferase RsmG [Octadecabacter sp. R77987]|uniref:16S rRNA (guanine(527)-N(7))-methyltransferase RsmG n=1 Tax=Octadecabacter sp. R77987 TaxID=3093874 RepID=UPI00366D8665